MLQSWLLVAHIAVLGYWLGSELVINSSYRYVCHADALPFPERDRLMDHVMHVDQHVRYALVLQASLGTMLAALFGYVPGGNVVVAGAAIAGLAWLVFVEIVHRLRHRPAGVPLATMDRALRYFLMAALVALVLGLIGGAWPMPLWLRWKLGLFAAVMMAGVGIRMALIAHFRVWAVMKREGPTAETSAFIRRNYVRATSVLVVLWLFIAGIVVLSVLKPI